MAKPTVTDVPKQKEMPVSAPQRQQKDVTKYGKAPTIDILLGWNRFATEINRKKYWDYFVIDQFIKGNHEITASASDNTLTVARPVESVNFPINKVYVSYRAVCAFITRHRPIVNVEPDGFSDEAAEYARRANAILRRDNRLNQYDVINEEWVNLAVARGVAYRQLGFDPERRVCIRWNVDPWTLKKGSKTGELEDAPFIIKDVIRTIGYLKNKYPDYKGDIAPDNELAADEYQKLSLQINDVDASHLDQMRMEEQTKIVHEGWYRTFEANSAGGYINKCVFIEEGILDFEETPFSEYPFVAYKTISEPFVSNPDSHLKHVIPPQRLLNLLETQMVEYNHIVNRGRFMMDKNSGFSVINTKEGQIIRKNPGKQVSVLNPPGINPNLTEQIRRANDYIDRLGMVNEATQGAVPDRVSSGDAIEALQMGDANQLVPFRSNFERSLEKEAAWVLKMYSLFEVEGLYLEDKVEESTDQFVAFGQTGLEQMGRQPEINEEGRYYLEENGGYYDILNILPDNAVKVSVTSQLGETRQARFNVILQLLDRGLPLQIALQLLEFPNTDDVLKRISDEVVADMQMQMQMQLLGGDGKGGQGTPEKPTDVPKEQGDMVTDPSPEQMLELERESLVNQLRGLRDEAAGAING